MSAGSSARTVPEPTRTASTSARSAWTRTRASSPVSHCEVPSAAAMRPSRLAAAFHDHERAGVAQAVEEHLVLAARRSCVRVELDRDAVAAEPLGAAGRERVGVGHGCDDARHARGDERVGAGAGTAGVGAGFEGDVGGGAGGAVARLLERGDLGVRATRTFVPALADDLPVAHEHAADQGVGRDRATPTLRQRERAVEPHLVLLADRRGLPGLPQATPGPCRRQRGRLTHARAAPGGVPPSIRTVTVGPGLSPGPPSTFPCGFAAGSRAPPGSPRELPPVGDFTLPRRRMFDCGLRP